MNETIIKILHCSHCNRRLTPSEIAFYGTTTTSSRCNDCRTVNRRTRTSRILDFLQSIAPERHVIAHRGFWDRVAVDALSGASGTSWVAAAIMYGCVTQTHEFTIRNGIVNYRNGNRWVQQRVARYARSFIWPELIGTLILDADLEQFNNVITAATTIIPPEFSIVSGEDIRVAYHERGYAPNQGGLRSSCMRYDEAQPYLDIYVKNPDVCKLIVTYNAEGQLMGRALLWTDINGEQFMDYPYCNDLLHEEFKNYAREHNIDCERQQARVVQLTDWYVTQLPSMDTMTAIDPMTGRLYSYQRYGNRNYAVDHFMCGHSTDGNIVFTGAIQRSVCPECNRNFYLSAQGWPENVCVACGHRTAVAAPVENAQRVAV